MESSFTQLQIPKILVPYLENNSCFLSLFLSHILDKGTIKLKVSVNYFKMFSVTFPQPYQALLSGTNKCHILGHTEEDTAFTRGKAESENNKAQPITAHLPGLYTTKENQWLVAPHKFLCWDYFIRMTVQNSVGGL